VNHTCSGFANQPLLFFCERQLRRKSDAGFFSAHARNVCRTRKNCRAGAPTKKMLTHIFRVAHQLASGRPKNGQETFGFFSNGLSWVADATQVFFGKFCF
jgi:hypothetical protein